RQSRRGLWRFGDAFERVFQFLVLRLLRFAHRLEDFGSGNFHLLGGFQDGVALFIGALLRRGAVGGLWVGGKFGQLFFLKPVSDRRFQIIERFLLRFRAPFVFRRRCLKRGAFFERSDRHVVAKCHGSEKRLELEVILLGEWLELVVVAARAGERQAEE